MLRNPPKFSDVIKPIRRIVGPIVFVCAMLGLTPLALLTVTARTLSGRIAGLTSISVILTIVATVIVVRAGVRDTKYIWAIAIPAVLCLILFSALLFKTVPNDSVRHSGLVSIFYDRHAYNRYSVWNIVPECDLVTLGAAILTRLDPWMTREHGSRSRRILNELYESMEKETSTDSVGGVADYAMKELTGGPFQNLTHYYVYIPEHNPDQRLGMIVLLHGNAGNLKVMAWAWKPFADRHKIAIICPTFGFGFWDDGGAEAVERSYLHAIQSLPIDPNRVWLGGISDGGKGVTRTAIAHPEHYGGLIYLSPTIILPEVGSEAFLSAWKGRPVLIFQGETDHNVLKRDVDPAAALMKSGLIDVDYHTFPNEDHFLFFARRAEIFDVLTRKGASTLLGE